MSSKGNKSTVGRIIYTALIDLSIRACCTYFTLQIVINEFENKQGLISDIGNIFPRITSIYRPVHNIL